MRNLLSGLGLIVATIIPTNSNAVLFDNGRYFQVYDRENQRWVTPVSGKCEYKGYTLHLSCDLEKDPGCDITETYDSSGKKLPTRFPDDICPPKVVIQYPQILYCFDSEKCDKEFMCC